MANFIDLRNRLIDLFGESQRAEVFERLNLARTEGHIPPARSRGDRKSADVTSLDCAVAILALVSSDRGYEAGKQLGELRALTPANDPGVRLDEFLADLIDNRRRPNPDRLPDERWSITATVPPLTVAAYIEIEGLGEEGFCRFGATLPIGKPVLGTARIISGEAIGAVADLLGPIEDAT